MRKIKRVLALLAASALAIPVFSATACDGVNIDDIMNGIASGENGGTDNPNDNTGNTGKPDDNTGNTGKPDDNTGNTGKPDDNTGNTGKPDDNTGNTGKPDDNTGNTGKPDDNTGNTGKPDDNTGNTGKPDDNPNGNTGNEGKPEDKPNTPSQAKLTPSVDADGRLKYGANTTLKMDIGDKSMRGIAYNSDMISGAVTLVDGNQYTAGSLKPAWAALSQKLGVNLQYEFVVLTGKLNFYDNIVGLGTIDLLTDTVGNITNAAYEKNDALLDLSLYLDYMPNYKAFLESNPATYYSLVSDTANGSMYYIPYYDGNDDIELYELAKTNWIRALLDDTTGGDIATTFRAQAQVKGLDGTAASAASFMGQTGSWSVDTTMSDYTVKKLVVNYDAALAAAKKGDTTLGLALTAAGVETAGLESGNIVDLQNAAINATEGEVTGAQLLAILQAYVDVAYQNADGGQFYTTRSDIFCGVNAGWDADLMTALYRCVVTNPSLLKSGKVGNTIGGEGATDLKNLYGLTARQANMQRQKNIYELAGELYGVRGLESRNGFSYIDGNGVLQDAREHTETYDAMIRMNALVKEGLVNVGANAYAQNTSFYSTNNSWPDGTVEALMMHDYVNTQTWAGFEVDGVLPKGTYNIEEDYFFTPIVTPVSRWRTSGDGEDTIMRFTESWRSVKSTGAAIPYDAVKNDPEKLSAMLKFIDYLYSDDGRIAMSYGPKAENKEGQGGFWYNEPATAAQIAAGQYFEYEGVKYYSEIFYAGAYQPTLTDNVMKSYLGEEVYGVNYAGGENWQRNASCVRNFTNYARYVIGSQLAIGAKQQSFEYQLTSGMGRYGVSVVDVCLATGTIKHVVISPEQAKDLGSLWYLISPTALPYTAEEIAALGYSTDKLNSSIFTTMSRYQTNYFWAIICGGYDTTNSVFDIGIGADAEGCIKILNGYYLSACADCARDAFKRTMEYLIKS